MRSIQSLERILETLPDGYLSRKNINGKLYHYLQYRSGNKIISKYIPNDMVEEVRDALFTRMEIELQIKAIREETRHIVPLSQNIKNLTGTLMSGDEPVAIFEGAVLKEITNNDLCPLSIKHFGNIHLFLKGRVMDTTRSNARLIKKALQLRGIDDDLLSLFCYGATVTDNYWFKPRGSGLKYADINFKSDFYADLSLKGEIKVFPKASSHNPQISAIGSYEKCWKIIDDEWWMIKSGTREEIFSELFCSRLAKLLNIPTAEYYISGPYIKTRNFAKEINFEPISSIAGDDDNYDNVFPKIYEISKDLAKDYLRLIWFDCLVNNIDRHNENLGLLRNRNDGSIISLAPNFDNNLALIARNKELNDNPAKDGMIRLFLSFLKHNNEATKLIKDIKFPAIDANAIKEILDDIDIKEDEDKIISYILNRFDYLHKNTIA